MPRSGHRRRMKQDSCTASRAKRTAGTTVATESGLDDPVMSDSSTPRFTVCSAKQGQTRAKRTPRMISGWNGRARDAHAWRRYTRVRVRTVPCPTMVPNVRLCAHICAHLRIYVYMCLHICTQHTHPPTPPRAWACPPCHHMSYHVPRCPMSVLPCHVVTYYPGVVKRR